VAVFVIFHLACTLAMVALLAFTPERGGREAVIFPPWYDTGQVLGAVSTSDGRLIRFGNASWIAVIAPSADRKHTRRILQEHGALAFINPMIVGGCSTAGSTPPSTR
jgi:hypothetical protein